MGKKKPSSFFQITPSVRSPSAAVFFVLIMMISPEAQRIITPQGGEINHAKFTKKQRKGGSLPLFCFVFQINRSRRDKRRISTNAERNTSATKMRKLSPPSSLFMIAI